MTTINQAYESIRQRHVDYMWQLMPEYVKRLSWSRTEIEAEQTRALRSLLDHANTHSPWHKERLASINPSTATIADLDKIPPMTKEDLMSNWDSIVTDKRTCLKDANTHLLNLKSDAYYLDEYHVILSGGSSGVRGVFLYDWHGWTVSYISLVRGFNTILEKICSDNKAAIASISAYVASHASSALSQTFSSNLNEIAHIPVTLPIDEIVNELNHVRPALIHCFPNILSHLCAKFLDGKLKFTSKAIWCTSEPLLPGDREVTERTFKVPLVNTWSASEVNGGSFPCINGGGFHISEDVCIIEPVNSYGKRVERGERADKIYMTNLFNNIMPLIRYEITDQFKVIDGICPCGSSFLKVEDVLGRTDDQFVYEENIIVHPLNYYSPLFQEPDIMEFLVHQTERGADIDVVVTGIPDFIRLESSIKSNLVQVGLKSPVVNICQVENIKRSKTGKLKRFIPLVRNKK